MDKPFDLYYVKGKDLILADFLSKIKTDKSDPGEVIPISFINKQNAENKSHHILNAGRVTRSAVKHEGLSMPTIHGHNKQLDPHHKPEHQVGLNLTPAQQTPPDRNPQTPPKNKPRTRSLPVSVCKHPTTMVTTSRWLIKKSIKTLSKDSKYPNMNPPMPPSQVPIVPQFDPLTGLKDPPFIPTTPNHVKPTTKQEPADAHSNTKELERGQKVDTDLSPPSYAGETVPGQPVDPDLDVGGPFPNFHNQAKVVVQSPLQEEIDAPVPLYKLVDTSKISKRRLPQQAEIDPILKEIETNILRKIHLPTSFRDLHMAYLNSPQFKDIYLYLLHHKTSNNPRKCTRVISQASDYKVLDQLLFKIVKDHVTRQHKPLLCIPTSKNSYALALLPFFLTRRPSGNDKNLCYDQSKVFLP